MRSILDVSFIIVSASVGTNIITNFSQTSENHNQRIERVAGY